MLTLDLFQKLVQPYVETTQLASLTNLHSLFWQQLPELLETSPRPQAIQTLQNLQRVYRQFVSLVLYPKLAQTAIFTIHGDEAYALKSFDLDWYQLTTPLFITKGEEAATGLNLFQTLQTFTFEELCVIPDGCTHLLQHLLFEIPVIPTDQVSFLFAPKHEQFFESDYHLYFINDANKEACLQKIHQHPDVAHYLVNLSSQALDTNQMPHVTYLEEQTWLTQLASLDLTLSHAQVLQTLEKQFLSYQHALELLSTYEHKQLTVAMHDSLRSAKIQQELKHLQQEHALWQTYYQRFTRLIASLPYIEQFEPFIHAHTQAQTSGLADFQRRTNRATIGSESHPFEALLFVNATPLAITPQLTQTLAEYLHETWHIDTPKFMETLLPSTKGITTDETN